MTLSISTCFDYSISLEEQCSLIKKHGFTHFSLGSRYEHSQVLTRVGQKNLKLLMKTHNLGIDTIHGCNADQEEAYDIMKTLIDAAVFLNVPIIVLHAVSGFEIQEELVEEKIKKVKALCQKLQVYLKDKPVKIALENLFPGHADQVLHEVMKSLDPQYFGFCYDSAHEQVDGPNPIDLPIRYKDSLLAVHLSDRVRAFYDHQPPGEGFIDFEAVCDAISKTSFKGPFLMEVMYNNSKHEDINEFLKATYQAGRKLSHKISGVR